MGLKVSGLEYEHREVLLRDKPASMLSASPKGTVPIFIQSNGNVIDESLSLLNFALKHSDPLGWLDCDKTEAESLIDENDGPFKHHLDRYKYASRYDDNAMRGDVNIEHREQAEKTITNYEDRLEGQPYLLGKNQTIADIAIFPFIRQFANTNRNWWDIAPYPATRNWLEKHVNSDIFLTIMEKFPLWKPHSKSS